MPISADNRRRAGHKKCSLTSLPITPPLTPPQGHNFRLLRGGGGGSTCHAVPRRRFTKSVHCAQLSLSKTLGCSIPPGCAFASLAAPAAHRQHHLHHPHQRLPMMRMMQVMLGMLPILVKEMKGGKGERISTAKGGERSQGGKGEDLGKKCLKGERGSLGGKGKSFSGGTGPKGQSGDRISIGKGGKRLWEVEILGAKGLRRETGERILSGKGGKRSYGGKGRRTRGKGLREERGGKDLWEEKGEELRVGKGLRKERGEINDLNKELGGGGKILGRKGRRSGAKRP